MRIQSIFSLTFLTFFLKGNYHLFFFFFFEQMRVDSLKLYWTLNTNLVSFFQAQKKGKLLEKELDSLKDEINQQKSQNGLNMKTVNQKITKLSNVSNLNLCKVFNNKKHWFWDLCSELVWDPICVKCLSQICVVKMQ